jgi:HEAT repeat protein
LSRSEQSEIYRSSEGDEERWRRDPLGYALEKMRDDAPETRAEAAMRLGLVGPSEVRGVLALAKALRDHARAVRVQASFSLLKCADAAGHAEAELLEALDDPDPEVRYTCAQVLAACVETGPRRLEALKRLRDNDADAEVRVRAAKAVWDVDSDFDTFEDRLRDALKSHEPNVRLAALECIEVAALVEAMAVDVLPLCHDPDASVGELARMLADPMLGRPNK